MGLFSFRRYNHGLYFHWEHEDVFCPRLDVLEISPDLWHRSKCNWGLFQQGKNIVLKHKGQIDVHSTELWFRLSYFTRTEMNSSFFASYACEIWRKITDSEAGLVVTDWEDHLLSISNTGYKCLSAINQRAYCFE